MHCHIFSPNIYREQPAVHRTVTANKSNKSNSERCKTVGFVVCREAGDQLDCSTFQLASAVRYPVVYSCHTSQYFYFFSL